MPYGPILFAVSGAYIAMRSLSKRWDTWILDTKYVFLYRAGLARDSTHPPKLNGLENSIGNAGKGQNMFKPYFANVNVSTGI